MLASSQAKKAASRISPYLMTSARPADSSRSGSVSQRVGIGQHQPRLIERADHVLAERMVDPGLAADRGIHLGEQRGRHLDERHAAQVDAAAKPVRSPITPPPSAISVVLRSQRCVEQRVEDVVERLPGLVRSRRRARSTGTRRRRHCVERRRQALQVESPTTGLVTIATRCLREVRHDQLRARQQAAADVDRVAALAQLDSARVSMRPRSSVALRRRGGRICSALEPLLELVDQALEALSAGLHGDVRRPRGTADRAARAARTGGLAGRRSAAAAGCGRGACGSTAR